MATKTKPEEIEFTMHPHLLWDIIHRQADTLAKAVLEGVMNSVDAGATKCDLTIDKDRITLVDDGKGFSDRKQIDDYFGTFGHPHVEGDARYGRFRMGRGQIFAYGASTWRTHTFEMSVDLKPQEGDSINAQGLRFSLSTDRDPVGGCRVDLDLYEKLNLVGIDRLEREVKASVKYVDVPNPLHTLLSPDKWNATFTIADRGDRVADRVHTGKLAFVISTTSAAKFGASSAKELLEVLQGLARTSGFGKLKCKAVEIDHFADFITEDYRTVDDKKLNKAERLAIKVIRDGYEDMRAEGYRYDQQAPGTFVSATIRNEVRAGSVRHTEWGQYEDWKTNLRAGSRRVVVGESDVALAWTDGLHTIWIERRQLKQIKRGVPGMYRIASLLLHEQLHEGPSTGTHEHGVEFYNRFHDIQMHSDLITSTAERMLRSAITALRAEPAGVGVKVLEQLDRREAAVESGMDPVVPEEPATDGATAEEVVAPNSTVSQEPEPIVPHARRQSRIKVEAPSLDIAAASPQGRFGF